MKASVLAVAAGSVLLLIALAAAGLGAGLFPAVDIQAGSPAPRTGIITVATASGTNSGTATGTGKLGLTSATMLVTPTVAAGSTSTPVFSLTLPAAGSTTAPGAITTPGAGPAGSTPVGAAARTITVVGQGKVSIQPDIARLNIGVESVRPTVQEAATQTQQAMNAVLQALKDQGIADKDIQTSGLIVFVDRSSPAGQGTATNQANYHVANNVTVTVRNLSQVSNVLDAAIRAGANNINGVNFGLSDPSKAEAQARELAVSDAQARARDLARLNGVQLGGVVSVSEVIGSSAVPLANSFSNVSAGVGGGTGGPISPGETELTMLLQITYAIVVP